MPNLHNTGRFSGNPDGKLQKAGIVCVAALKMWQSITIDLKNMPVYGWALD